MTHKVIIADDSKNIQKVVEIILDERECEIQSCSSEVELSEKLEASKCDVVFLDFSLSENKDGYDLANIIKSKNDVKVIILFGTFDAVDENKIEANKIDDYIFKPFDAEKFLNIYDKAVSIDSSSGNLIEESLEELSVNDHDPMNDIVNSLEVDEQFPIDERVSEQDWGMDLPPMLGDQTKSINPAHESLVSENELPEIIDDINLDMPPPIASVTPTIPDFPTVNQLSADIPDVENVSGLPPILQSNEIQSGPIHHDMNGLPPIIDSENGLPEVLANDLDSSLPNILNEDEETKLPSTDDLEYPGKLPEKLDEPSPALVSIETLNLDETSEKIHLEKLDLKADEEKLSKLKEEILGELEDDLWDENTRTMYSLSDLKSEETGKNLKIDLEEFKQDIKKQFAQELQEEVRSEVIKKLSKEMRQELEIDIRKAVLKNIREELPTIVKNFCADELVQEVWKIVPEISEKLISSELEQIRNSLD